MLRLGRGQMVVLLILSAVSRNSTWWDPSARNVLHRPVRCLQTALRKACNIAPLAGSAKPVGPISPYVRLRIAVSGTDALIFRLGSGGGRNPGLDDSREASCIELGVTMNSTESPESGERPALLARPGVRPHHELVVRRRAKPRWNDPAYGCVPWYAYEGLTDIAAQHDSGETRENDKTDTPTHRSFRLSVSASSR